MIHGETPERPSPQLDVWEVRGYLESHPNPLGQGSFWKDRLYVRDNGAAEDASFRTNQVTVLPDPRHHRKELWEISGDDAANTPPVQLLRGVQGCGGQSRTGGEREGGGGGGGERWGGTLTLVHVVEEQVELLLRLLAVMLLPALTALTAQDHQLPLASPQGRKVGDLHDDGPGEGRRQDRVRTRSADGEETDRQTDRLMGVRRQQR